jgi:prolyl-tRNA synthetase
MKDCYSFHASPEDLNTYYELQKSTYVTIFNKMGIGDKTFLTYASGGTFSKYSHEFQTVCEAGEDIIYYLEEENIAFNDEIVNDPDVRKEFDLDNKSLKELKTVEVGNIFKLNTKFSEPFQVTYKDSDGKEKIVYM